MNNSNLEFVPERLIDLRKARRIYSKSGLAKIIGVNASTVSRWEEGDFAPEASTLSLLAASLGVREEYFFRQTSDISPIFYRSLSSSLIRDKNYQEVQIKWLTEISRIIEHYVDYPVLDIPDFMNGSAPSQLRDEDIENIALSMRAHWKLGEGPCVDIVTLMERIGCIVASVEMGTAKLDGLCTWSKEQRPHVLLATDKMSYTRRQMDAAHELSHLVLHKNVLGHELVKNLKDIEAQAFRLASAFLMPSTSYLRDISRVSLQELLNLKTKWRVSVKAQIKRLSDLDVISEDYARDLYKSYSARGWNKGEPLENTWELSEPSVVASSVKLIVESGIRTKRDLLDVEFPYSAGDIESLASLPYGWFKSADAKVISLKGSLDKPNSCSEILAKYTGNIIPFKNN